MAEKTITVIPARKRVGSRKQVTEEKPKLRVAAYCRVSTDRDEQESSYEAQVEHYTEFIDRNPEWQLAGIYADDGISGTNTKKREEFNRMIEDCMASKIDMVITKSISRFARNTLDCLKYIRQLKEKNISVYFEKENINTMDAKGEVLLTIMASLAQQESQSLSQNVKLGLQFRYQAGKVQVNHNRFLGYTKDDEGNLVIVPEEAEIVLRIYREYLEGASLFQIGQGLEADGIKTAAGSDYWLQSTLKKILTNEKYIGDALLQKTYTVDFLNKKRVANNGIVPQYYVENSHPAIIPREKFMKVREEMYRRAHMECGPDQKRRIYSSRYALSSIVYCAHCNDIFRRINWNNRGCKSTVWRCLSRVEKDRPSCTARTVKEELLHEVVVRAVNEVITGSSSFIPAPRPCHSRILRIVKRAETLRDVVFLFQRDQHAARDVFEFVGHHIAAAAKLFERRGIVIRRHDVPVAQRERGGVGRRVEAQRARPEQVRLLDDHQPQLTAAHDTDRFRFLCHSRLPCRIKVLPPVRRRSVSHGTLRAGQPAPHPAERGSTRLSAPRSSPR